MVYEPGPIQVADSDVATFSRDTLLPVAEAALARMCRPARPVTEEQWSDKRWIGDRRKAWLKALGARSVRGLCANYKLIELVPGNAGTIHVIPTHRDGNAYMHKQPIAAVQGSIDSLLDAMGAAMDACE